MKAVAVRVERVSKRYPIGSRERYRTLRETLVGMWSRPFHRTQTVHHIWALDDVSFDVSPGEVIGIIGRNGAGKSTLLRILSRITRPTKGFAEIHGRVGSLLEVGTGFHPELSGRENIFLNGSILGMRRHEIQRRFDDIVAFAEIDEFIDTAVKHYSSGMYTRLAFAVAAHLETEILLVDEVLAVGDAAFQKKCLGKMGEVATQGRTVLLVSHNLQAVSTLARQSLLLSKGRLEAFGPTNQVIADYSRQVVSQALVYADRPSPTLPKVTRVEVRTSEPHNVQSSGAPMEVHVEITTPTPVDGASLSFQVCNYLQQPIAHLWTFDSERPMCRAPGVYHLTCRIPQLHLYIGHYTLKVYFSERAGGDLFQTIDGICPFEVVLYGRPREFEWRPGTCTYLEDFDWLIRQDPPR